MTAPLLLLHEHHTPDDGDIWRVAIRRGWKTERVNRFTAAQYVRDSGADFIRYYGNLLHWAIIKGQIPLTMLDASPNLLPSCEFASHRPVRLLRYAELNQPIRSRTFVKPVCVKWFEARIYEEGELVTGSPELNDLIYTSPVVDFVDEVRCF